MVNLLLVSIGEGGVEFFVVNQEICNDLEVRLLKQQCLLACRFKTFLSILAGKVEDGEAAFNGLLGMLPSLKL
jgi:hypothetical protein